jgi:hypothetical protein
MTGIDIIAKERKRQIEKEGFDAKHDSHHLDEELADAAASYAMSPMTRESITSLVSSCEELGIPPTWPFDNQWWKPSDDRIKELAKAGALIAAEIDRLLALKEKKKNGKQN